MVYMSPAVRPWSLWRTETKNVTCHSVDRACQTHLLHVTVPPISQMFQFRISEHTKVTQPGTIAKFRFWELQKQFSRFVFLIFLFQDMFKHPRYWTPHVTVY